MLGPSTLRRRFKERELHMLSCIQRFAESGAYTRIGVVIGDTHLRKRPIYDLDASPLTNLYGKESITIHRSLEPEV